MRRIIEEGLIEDGVTVVLGLSGGPDSVCLLYELLAMDASRRAAGGEGNHVVCAHINHGLRGEESDCDEAFVLALCERFGLPAEFRRINAAALAKEAGLTVEEAGRAARYAFFDEVCKKYEAAGTARGSRPVVAVAHNQDDQIETVFMRLLRGTGVDGLAGIPPRRKSAAGFDVVRPLLPVSKDRILERLMEYGADFRTDSSNAETAFFRNKIRLEIFPYIEERLDFNPRRGLSRLAENAAEDKAFFDTVVSGMVDEYVEYDGEGCESDESAGSVSLPAELLASVHPAIRHRLIRAVFWELGLRRDIAAVHLNAADRLLRTWREGGEASGKRVEFPLDFTFGIAGKKAVFRTPAAAEPGWKPRRKHTRSSSDSPGKPK